MTIESPKTGRTWAFKSPLDTRGFYVVTHDAQLGTYDEAGAFISDPPLSDALAPCLRELLASYLSNPENPAARIGLLYRAPEPRLWDAATLLLEDHVVRDVYPVGGPPSHELTVFQKKNKEKSAYRGAELLIEYRHDAAPDESVYYPLLYDRGTTLDQYPGAGATKQRVPVLEVLNLIPALSSRRRHPEVPALIERMRRDLIRKDLRRGSGLTLIDLQGRASTDGGGAFFDVDKRHDRRDSWRERLAAAEYVQQSDRVANVERWLERPYRPVDAALLRHFLSFRDLESDRLAWLASKALVHTAPAGVTLLSVGAKDAWNMYLLEGTLALAAPDRGSMLVSGGSDKAASPISFLKPRKYAVSAVTPVSFLWVHDAVLAAVLPTPAPQIRSIAGLKR